MNGRILEIAIGAAMVVLVVLLVPGLRYTQHNNAEKPWEELVVDAVRAIKAGMLDKAYEYCDAAMAAAGEPRPGDTRLSRTFTLLGEIHNSAGEPQAALDALKKGVELCEQSCGPMSKEMLEPLDALANFHFYRDELTEVEPIQERIARIAELARAQAERDQANRSRNLAQVQWKLGKLDQAERGFQECLTAGKAAGEVFRSEFLHDSLTVSEFYRERGRHDQAERLAERALAMAEAAEPRNEMDIVQCLDGLARIHLADGTQEHGRHSAEQALKLAEKVSGSKHADLAPRLELLARISRKQGAHVEAEQYWLRAIAVTENDLGLDSPELASFLEPYAALLLEMGKADEAKKIEERLAASRRNQQEIVLGDGAPCKSCGGAKSDDPASKL
jgi:tetratricopeptide (TPR) repeat protein